mgnify:CR=1 FL=1
MRWPTRRWDRILNFYRFLRVVICTVVSFPTKYSKTQLSTLHIGPKITFFELSELIFKKGKLSKQCQQHNRLTQLIGLHFVPFLIMIYLQTEATKT